MSTNALMATCICDAMNWTNTLKRNGLYDWKFDRGIDKKKKKKLRSYHKKKKKKIIKSVTIALILFRRYSILDYTSLLYIANIESSEREWRHRCAGENDSSRSYDVNE